MNVKIGIGYDIHRFKKGRPLWLGGVLFKNERGLDGHSDADALLHAIIDALLGAAGLPDIGHYFPPGDPKTKNIPSATMIGRALREIEKQGYNVVNVDSTIVTELPKMAPYREAMRKKIALVLHIRHSAVGITVTSGDGLTDFGCGDGLQCFCMMTTVEV